MQIIIAYGLPGSGKTTLLNKLYEDSNSRKIFLRHDVKRSVELFEQIKNSILQYIPAYDIFDEIYIDYLFKKKEIINLYEFIDGNVDLFTNLELTIHRFNPDIEQCLKNDKMRGRELSAKGTINKMKVKKISSDDFVLSENSKITVIEHEVYRGA